MFLELGADLTKHFLSKYTHTFCNLDRFTNEDIFPLCYEKLTTKNN